MFGKTMYYYYCLLSYGAVMIIHSLAVNIFYMIKLSEIFNDSYLTTSYNCLFCILYLTALSIKQLVLIIGACQNTKIRNI